MKTKKMYLQPIAYVIEVEEDEIMLSASASSSFNTKGLGANGQHKAADWFNDKAGDDLAIL